VLLLSVDVVARSRYCLLYGAPFLVSVCSILSECVPFLVSVFSGAANRSEDARKEAGRKAARTRAERYGEELKVSAEENDDLKGTDTTK